MGLQVRKRTKGKNGWWNGSYSRKGAGVSGSVKVHKNVTFNTGDILNGKNKARLTINLGNGVRYVKYSKSKEHPGSDLFNAIIGIGSLLLLFIVGFVVFTLFVNFFWQTSAVVAVLVGLYYIGLKNA